MELAIKQADSTSISTTAAKGDNLTPKDPHSKEVRATPNAGNIFVSYGRDEDRFAAEKGFTFLGVAKTEEDAEIHIFQMESLADANARINAT